MNRPLKIAITSQNFRTITGHAGKTRRFLLYEVGDDRSPREVQRLDLPKEMALHAYRGEEHPLFQVDVVITGSCGPGFIQRLGRYGVRVIPTSERDPLRAVATVAAGDSLPPPEPQAHAH